MAARPARSSARPRVAATPWSPTAEAAPRTQKRRLTRFELSNEQIRVKRGASEFDAGFETGMLEPAGGGPSADEDSGQDLEEEGADSDDQPSMTPLDQLQSDGLEEEDGRPHREVGDGARGRGSGAGFAGFAIVKCLGML